MHIVCALWLVACVGGATGNGLMPDRELNSVKKRRRSQNSDYEDEDSYYRTHITEERYRSMLGEHIQKYKRRFKDSSSSPAPTQMGIPVPKGNKGLKSRKLANEQRGGFYDMETTSEWLNDSNTQKPGNHHDADFAPQSGTNRFAFTSDFLLIMGYFQPKHLFDYISFSVFHAE